MARPSNWSCSSAAPTAGRRGGGFRRWTWRYAAGDCVHTYHRLLDQHVYLPLGSTADKQGRVAGTNALGGIAVAGSLGTQAVKVFDRVVAGTGLRDTTAPAAEYDPLTVEVIADNHKAYYPGATPIRIRLTGGRTTGRLLGAQLLGQSKRGKRRRWYCGIRRRTASAPPPLYGSPITQSGNSTLFG
ncbi:hypothetical protein [Dactylosporangium sp. NPDC048998]|uniref:hypothetical protein n=1 Tax=Dactylosporangium sp. NPDC048998 TaxID=3363976 RepID=UPI00371AB8C0